MSRMVFFGGSGQVSGGRCSEGQAQQRYDIGAVTCCSDDEREEVKDSRSSLLRLDASSHGECIRHPRSADCDVE